MDLYLTSTEPGLTLQEMIDCDIKSGVEFESGFPSESLLGAFDFPNLTAGGVFDSDLDLKSLEPLFDPLIHSDDEAMDAASGGSAGAAAAATEVVPIASWMNLSSMANCNLDLETSLMVNPSLVLPSSHHPPPSLDNKPTPKFNPHSKPDSSDKLTQNCRESHSSSTVTTQVVLRPCSSSPRSETAVSSEGPNRTAAASPLASRRPSGAGSAARPESPVVSSALYHRHPYHHPNGAAAVHTSSPRPTNGLVYAPSRTKSVAKYRRERTPDDKAYPKPAYSYACLIALALKNSITGSLPVSEIYNFMCEHFPYFRTAPNGWKNSVRHNLSLNKCFEKIEKPVVSGSNQRKGCLWALNPLKIHKMDEEVQKWSKKDLQGIRDAMTCPEILDALEKGEMKFEASSGASSCSEDEEDEDVSVDLLSFAGPDSNPAPIKVISSSAAAGHRVPPQNGLLASSSAAAKHRHAHVKDIDFFSTVNNVNLSRNPAALIASSAASSSPDYILPELPEINIQSNGTLIDDFGNEITLDGELSILNPRAGRNGATTLSVAASGPTNLILKKVTASPLRNGHGAASANGLRSNILVAASPASVGPAQNTVTRLVLANSNRA